MMASHWLSRDSLPLVGLLLGKKESFLPRAGAVKSYPCQELPLVGGEVCGGAWLCVRALPAVH